MGGYIKLPRSILEWEWFDDPNALRVYIKLLFMAEFRDRRYMGCELKRGQLLTTIPKISELCRLSVQQTRTVLERLKSTDKITVKTTNKFSIITLIEYDCDFENNRQGNRQITGKQQTIQQSNNSPTLLFKEEREQSRNQETALTRGGVGIDERFNVFWEAYPNKEAKARALSEWKKLKPDDELLQIILAALEWQRKSERWTKENGKYVSLAANYLKDQRWKDPPPAASGQPNKPYSDKAKMTKHKSSFDTDKLRAQIMANYGQKPKD